MQQATSTLPPRRPVLLRPSSAIGAQDGRDRNRLFLVVGDLDGAGIDIFVLMSEAESTGGKADDAEEDKDNSKDELRVSSSRRTFHEADCARGFGGEDLVLDRYRCDAVPIG